MVKEKSKAAKTKKVAAPDKAKTDDVAVKIDRNLYNEVQAHKDSTGISIIAFVNMAVKEKLKRDKK
jgi:hypothetical protein